VAELSSAGGGRPWHQALTFAVTGRRVDLGEQPRPEIAQLGQQLLTDLGRAPLADHVLSTRAAGRPWPHPVPADLMQGLGYAQFAAALAELQAALGLEEWAETRRVGQAQPTTPADRRLLDEVPPHHGT